jgi:Tfp pilus assembly protein PilP
MSLVKTPQLIAAGLMFGAVMAAPVAAQVPATTIPIGTKVGESPKPGSYESLGRRDPFLTLVTPRRAASPNQPHLGTGLGSFFVNDVTVTGIVKAPGGMMAIVQSVDKQSYVAKVKDRLADAVIKSIDGTSVVFLEVPEPGSFGKPREIRKVLHAIDEVNR